VLAQADAYFRKQPGVARTIAVAGFSFSGNGQNAGLAFVRSRTGRSADRSSRRRRLRSARQGAVRHPDAIIFPLSPPPIRELGNATGFTSACRTAARKATMR
jgi:multidrug efflux pump